MSTGLATCWYSPNHLIILISDLQHVQTHMYITDTDIINLCIYIYNTYTFIRDALEEKDTQLADLMKEILVPEVN